jgi:acetyl-CoA acetyltransferase family protein
VTVSQPVCVVDYARTPIGKFNGALSAVRPDDLAATVLRALAARHPDAVGDVDDIYVGNANGAGEENRNVARMAALLAGLPVRVPGATVNRLCGSGLEAVIQARRAIACGDADLVIAGGVESMTRAPYVLPKDERPYQHHDKTMYSTSIGWRMVNSAMPAEHTIPMGEGAEILAEKYGITRSEQDEFALASHHNAYTAWQCGRLGAETVPGPYDLQQDESIRPGGDLETLGRLRPAFRPAAQGTVTAGNSSPLSDGAAAVLLASESAVREYSLTPLARITASGATALEPALFGLGPVEATAKALSRAGLGLTDVSVFEVNEAFAAQVLACLQEWETVPPSRVNPNGGAIAIGHPLGCTGARLVGTLAMELRSRGGGAGVATACIGVGQGLAVVLEA